MSNFRGALQVCNDSPTPFLFVLNTNRPLSHIVDKSLFIVLLPDIFNPQSIINS